LQRRIHYLSSDFQTEQHTPVTPEKFVAKWTANTRTERAASQEHFLDLCRLLDEPTPNEDPDGATYAFEKGATKASGGEGWADVWRRGRFAWEYKGKHKDLEAAHKQLLQYAGALENPPLLIVSDMARIVIRTNFTGFATERHDLLIEELTDPKQRQKLKWAFTDPDRLRPTTTRQGLTEKAATEFAAIAARLRGRGHDAHAVAHFLARLAFCAFADDIKLLPPGLFERMLAAARKNPAQSATLADQLFTAMANKGGRVGYEEVAWFNGGLFDSAPALPLDAEDIAIIQRAAALDWSEIDPSILGTLFERGLDPDKRSQLGAHYTDRDKIEALIDPVIRRPLLAEWDTAKTEITALVPAWKALVAKADRSRTARDKAAAAKAEERAHQPYRAFLARLHAFRVLDPACGSGNFLYLALLALKDLELRVDVEAEALGLRRQLLIAVGPEQVLGIEINPYAAELARVSVWIGDIQWTHRNGLSAPRDPILRALNTIECRDAVLAADGTPAPWPQAHAIVSNPPFLGDKAMIGTLGEAYVDRLRGAYAGRVPGGADLVCYWFDRAREEVAAGRTERAGLVGTNSLRGGANRQVLDRIGEAATIFEAWSDEPWTVEGAAVRVSLVCFGKLAMPPYRLDGQDVPRINADLTSAAADLTTARPLEENQGVAFSGITKKGPFEIGLETARSWFVSPTNAAGQQNQAVLMPWWNGDDVTSRLQFRWIIDFGELSEGDASYFVEPFAYVTKCVKSQRDRSNTPSERTQWWKLARRAWSLRRKLAGLDRFIVTPELSKHRLFVWAEKQVLPDKNLVAIARSDDTSFGILHSRYHEAWALRLGTSLEDRPRYTSTTTFRTFPFPEGLAPNVPAASYAGDPRAQNIATAARALTEARDRWLNPPELVERVPEVVPGFPDRLLPKNPAAAAALKTRTLTNLYNQRGTPEGAWLDGLHRTLDAAVAAAYGWPATISTEDTLAALLALNQARSA
jgi:type II restriction/modification system DNA methylase subunit YeeA